MNLIEQAAKRLEELQRAGVDVPWEAAGLNETEARELLSRGQNPARETAERAPANEPKAVVPAEVAEVAAPVPEVPAVTEPAPHAPSRFAPKIGPRQSQMVEFDTARLAANGYLVPGGPRSQLEEEFRIIKRPLLKNIKEPVGGPLHRGNLLMVTSALPGEGKTFSAINLAMSLAMELDHTVLLVDADVVRPSVLGRLGVGNQHKGLMDTLADPSLDLSDVILRTNIPKLALLPAGTPNPRATEMLASGIMEELLDELGRWYEDRIVVFDAPPLLPSTESRVLATRMGQIVMVVEAGGTTKSAVTQAFAAVESCPVVMSMLNKCRGMGPDSSYGYYGYY